MNHKNFDWGYFLKHIAIIAVPVALQNLLTTTGSMVDTIMLASIGEKAVGAVGLCAQFSSLMFAGYWGFVGGGMLFFSQYWGARDHDGITRSYGMTLLFMMTVGVLFACLAIFAPEFVMGVYTDKPEIQKIGISYLRIVGFAYPLQVIAMAASALLRSIEQVKIPLYGGIASVVANCFFNYLFIFGKFGLPKMGAAGAAVGTVMAGIVNVLILVICILYKRIPYVLEFSRHFRWSKVYVKQYLEKCFPIICNEVFIGVGNMLINIVLGRQSEQAIAAVAVFRTLEGLIIAFFSGFSNAAYICSILPYPLLNNLAYFIQLALDGASDNIIFNSSSFHFCPLFDVSRKYSFSFSKSINKLFTRIIFSSYDILSTSLFNASNNFSLNSFLFN